MKFKSKDLMEHTGDKFNDLYMVSHKVGFIKPKIDKPLDEIEFEKERNQHTFKPNLRASKKSLQQLKSIEKQMEDANMNTITPKAVDSFKLNQFD